MKINPRLIIGLGNPGKEYEKTYHNVGFLAVDFFANLQLPITNYQLLKSNVFMNQSGSFVKAALKKYKLKPKEILIVHDDSDIELGKYKISFGRGSAGHRGVESIIKSIGSKNFWRLRIGIRKDAENVSLGPRSVRLSPRLKASELVLRKIYKEDLKTLNQVFKEICLKLKQLF